MIHRVAADGNTGSVHAAVCKRCAVEDWLQCLVEWLNAARAHHSHGQRVQASIAVVAPMAVGRSCVQTQLLLKRCVDEAGVEVACKEDSDKGRCSIGIAQRLAPHGVTCKQRCVVLVFFKVSGHRVPGTARGRRRRRRRGRRCWWWWPAVAIEDPGGKLQTRSSSGAGVVSEHGLGTTAGAVAQWRVAVRS